MKAYLEVVELKVSDIVTSSQCPTEQPGGCPLYCNTDN